VLAFRTRRLACKALYTGSIPVSASPDSVISGNIASGFARARLLLYTMLRRRAEQAGYDGWHSLTLMTTGLGRAKGGS
jgi:hypothetical protein